MLIQTSKILSITTEPLYLLILAITISAALYLKNQKPQAILLASTSIFTALLIKILKNIIQAPRPPTSLILETGYSFPSGHTTFAIIFFGLLAYIFTKTKQQKIIFSILATITVIAIATSRLILQVHHPIDIIAGILIGTSILITSILIHNKLK